MATQFKVSGELTLSGQQFVSAAKEAKAATEGVSSASAKLADTSRTVTAATTTLTEAASKQTQATTAQTQATTAADAAGKAHATTLQSVEQESRKLADTDRTVTTSMATVSEAVAKQTQAFARAEAAGKAYAASLQTVEQAGKKVAAPTEVATVDIAAQAAGFARLAQQRAADAAKADSSALMTSVEQSTAHLAALYTPATISVRKLGDETERLKASNEGAARSFDAIGTKLTAYQKTQLGFQLNDVFTSLAGGINPLMVAAQQGPQITQVFGGIGNTLKAIPLGAAGAAAGIGLVAGAAIGLVLHLNELNAQQRQTEIALQATGHAAQVTAAQLEAMVETQARQPGAGRGETQQAALQLLGNNELTGQALEKTLSLARDLARVTGQDLPTAAMALSAGLDGTVAGALRLDAAFNALTPVELEQIKRYTELGDKGAAIGVMLTAMQRNLGDANAKGVSPLEKSTAQLRASWQGMLDTLARSGVISLAAGALNTLIVPLAAVANLAQTIKDLGGGTSQVPTAEDIDKTRRSLEVARQQLAALQAQRATASPFKYPELDNSIAAAETNVRSLTGALNDAERRAGAAAGKTINDQIGGQATALNKELKEIVALLDRSGTIAGQRRALEGELQQLQEKSRAGVLDPDTLARVNERMTTIRGSLAGLRTPAEELQRALDQQSKLATLPPNQAAPLQAFLDTYRQMLEATGDKDKALQAANQARANVLQTQATGTGQQIQLLSAEAQAALKVADAYGTSRAAALRMQAQLKAEAAEQQGEIAGGTAGTVAQQTLEETAASAIAAAAEKNEAYGRETAALGRLVDAEAKGSAAAREAERANKVATVAEDLRAQAIATNNPKIIAAVEQQIAVYDAWTKKELARNVQRDAQNLNTQYDPTVAYDLETKKLQELQATGLLTARTVEEYTRQSEQRRLEASRDATDGMIAGLRRYADEATNAGAAAADGVKQGFQTMEDALVQFVTTGKISVGDLANSIIADFARVAIRNVTGPLAKGLSSVLGSVVGSIFGSGGIFGSGAGISPNAHTGGLVANLSASRPIDPAWYAGAPRYHGGGIVGLRPDERPAILTENEEVITSSDPRHRWNLGAGGGYGGGMGAAPVVNLSVVNNGPPMDAKQGQTTPDGRGGWNIDLVLDLVDDGMAQRASNGRGKFMGVLAGSYGVRKQPRR